MSIKNKKLLGVWMDANSATIVGNKMFKMKNLFLLDT